MVKLPAVVYELDGGVFESMIGDLDRSKRIRIADSDKTRWPLVHKVNFAALHALMIEKGAAGAVYNAATIAGTKAGCLAEILPRRFGLTQKPGAVPETQAGQFFRLYTNDTVLS